MSPITLNNQYTGTVNWQSGALCHFIINEGADIWRINVNSNLPRLDSFLSVLDHDEIKRADKYLREADRDRFITSRAALRYILAGYLKQAAAGIRFGSGKNNKPFINYPHAPQLHFNLSDSADHILIAVAGSAVGIDVEWVDPHFAYHEILNSNFSGAEADYINAACTHKRFFLLWTRKEAILKATGIGLTDYLQLIGSLDGKHLMDGNLLSTGDDWQLNSFEPAENYVATIAVKTAVKNYNFFEF